MTLGVLTKVTIYKTEIRATTTVKEETNLLPYDGIPGNLKKINLNKTLAKLIHQLYRVVHYKENKHLSV